MPKLLTTIYILRKYNNNIITASLHVDLKLNARDLIPFKEEITFKEETGT